MENEPSGKKNLIIGIIIGLVIIGLGIGAFFYSKRNVTISEIKSFEECAKAGYPTLESYPRQCNSPDGQTFTEKIEVATTTPTEICQDSCGDGICQQIVCMGGDCPCAETAQNCAKDCGKKAKPALIK